MAEWIRFVLLGELGAMLFCTGVLRARWHADLARRQRLAAAAYSWLLVTVGVTVTTNLVSPVPPTAGAYVGAALLLPAAIGMLATVAAELHASPRPVSREDT